MHVISQVCFNGATMQTQKVKSLQLHSIIWGLAFLLVLGSLVVAGARNSWWQPEQVILELPEKRVNDAIASLEQDENMLLPETQLAVRAASVPAEMGMIATAEAAYVLALQYQREQNYNGAETYFKRAISLAPEWSWPYTGLGSLLARHTLGRTEEAEAALRKAITLDPRWSRPHINLAVMLRLEERYEEAEEEALIALALNPESIAIHNNYANLLLAMERYEEAERHYRKAIELGLDHPKPYYNLACLYSLMGDVDAALRYLQEAVDRADILRDDALRDSDFDPIREDSRFIDIVHGE